MFATNGFDLAALDLVQNDLAVGHSMATPVLELRLRRPFALTLFSPTS
jgi:hypothetical protein